MQILTLSFSLVAVCSYCLAADVLVNITSNPANETAKTKLKNDELRDIKNQLQDLSKEFLILRLEYDLLKKRLDNVVNEQRPETSINTETTNQCDQSSVTLATVSTPSASSQPLIAAPTSCAEAMQENADHIHSGVYLLHLPDMPPFEAFCLKDTNNGSAWTIVQKRQDGSINFYRDWVDYKNGFGNLYGEFWLGLDKIHALTKVSKQELWIYLEDFEGEVREAKYDVFAIGNEKSKYKLSTLGIYKGDSGDSLRHHFNSKFSTRDSDNDGDPIGSCARAYKGAWWFYKCSNSDLNGEYLLRNDPNVQFGSGVEWFTWRGHYSLKRVHMAMRPKATPKNDEIY